MLLSLTGYTIDNTTVSLRTSDEELDAEGAAADEKYFYVTGSHSAKRKTCESNSGKPPRDKVRHRSGVTKSQVCLRPEIGRLQRY
ncbi:DUF3616 domain-containing protein [Bradyrhizobium elkanii]|uniref:DUF3616 domain-containing protein n=1 Tax=Bradyrhizobium elkanii TaxID=29448 RepID=UPI003BADB72B